MATMIAGARLEAMQQQSLLHSHLRASPCLSPTRLSSTPFILFPPIHLNPPRFPCNCSAAAAQQQQKKKNDEGKKAQAHKSTFSCHTAITASAAGLLPLLLNAKEAWAVSGEFGLLEGRSLSLVHPIVMGGLFVYTLWAGYLGWQWRSIRTIQDEINELKKQVKPKEEGGAATPPSSVEVKINELTEARKQLLKGGYRDRHFNAGSILLAFGVVEAIGGSLNTWFRTGKLFPGPHLFAGAGDVWQYSNAIAPFVGEA
ncbi:hypothetical protein O6H91_13G019300 [Diphasiastrum complanatum]|uniref:Uncharacterized protein n=1 Tax=Diphasiastrum complanatum TaxID=34168 RepID=A0ACC2BSN2_DIPCM|nr:hypothetical protein O6H91_13G019300 [Diphasiastrum complanatum]